MTKENEDCISRQAVSEWLHNCELHRLADRVLDENKFPPVTPQRPKGKWIYKNDNIAIPTGYYQCSECGEGKLLVKDNFCPNCGAEMEVEKNDREKER